MLKSDRVADSHMNLLLAAGVFVTDFNLWLQQENGFYIATLHF